MTTLPIKRRRFTDFSIENILREPFQVREFDQNRSNATWICLPVHFSDLSTSLTSIWSSIIKLAILSAVPGDFLRVSVSPVSGEKSQDPPSPWNGVLVPHLIWPLCSKENGLMIMTLVCSKISTKLSAQLGNEALCIMMAHFIQPREKQKSRDSLLQNETFVICYRLNFPCG